MPLQVAAAAMKKIGRLLRSATVRAVSQVVYQATPGSPIACGLAPRSSGRGPWAWSWVVVSRTAVSVLSHFMIFEVYSVFITAWRLPSYRSDTILNPRTWGLRTSRMTLPRICFILAVCGFICLQFPLHAQLFDKLQQQSSWIELGSFAVESEVSPDGPKGIVTADFDNDGNADIATGDADGTIDVLYGDGSSGFAAREVLETGTATLRGIVTADFDGAGRQDIAAADPFTGVMILYLNDVGGRSFGEKRVVETWKGARNLVAEDFDGDSNVDLVLGGAGVGLRQFSGDGAGGFTATTDVAELFVRRSVDPYELRPVYTLRSFRPVGSALPKLAATHVFSGTLWILGADAVGVLQIEGRLFAGDAGLDPVHDFEIAPVSGPLNSAVPDLITVSKVRNMVTVWRGAPTAPYFYEIPHQRFSIPGAPRSVEVADTDDDGWGELGIVVRNFNRALIYRNRFGLLEPMVELPTGYRPRDLVMPDLNGDGCADVAMVTTRFVYESRVMVAGDFDQDGDLDIAGAGATGEAVVLVNNGDLFANPNPERLDVTLALEYRSNLRTPVLRDLNGDDDPDLVVASDGGLLVWFGGEGAAFFPRA